MGALPATPGAPNQVDKLIRDDKRRSGPTNNSPVIGRSARRIEFLVMISAV
jgi:hypothetical protein